MKKLRIHYLQHVPFEGLGYIETWAKAKGHELSATKFFEQHTFPSLTDFDWLIIMGGPMGVYEENIYSWLKAEKQFIHTAIEANKTVIGICLGSQLIATALGARVYSNSKKEIGWFPVSLTAEGKNNALLSGFPDPFPAFHWHGDTFDIPAGAVHLMHTSACLNQGFLYKNKVLGLQFHLEATPLTVKGMITHCGHELVADAYIQSETTLLEQSTVISETNKILTHILDRLAK